jgi:hypothetical protein
MKPVAWIWDAHDFMVGIGNSPDIIGDYNGFCNILWFGLGGPGGGIPYLPPSLPWQMNFYRPDQDVPLGGRPGEPSYIRGDCSWINAYLAGQTSSAAFDRILDLALDVARNEFVFWIQLTNANSPHVGAPGSLGFNAGITIAYRTSVARWNCNGPNVMYFSPGDWAPNPFTGERLCQDAMGQWPGPQTVTVTPA